jgi:hypothetical protein
MSEPDMTSQWPTLEPGWYIGGDGAMYYFHGRDSWDKFLPGMNDIPTASMNAPSRYTKVTKVA